MSKDDHAQAVTSQTALQPSAEFVKLFLTNEARLYAFIVSIVPNRADADEIFQETGLTVWQKFAEFTVNTDFLAWACRIAQNKVLNLRMRRHRSPVLFDTEFVELVAQERLAHSSELDARYTALLGCLDRLRPADRSLLENFYREGTTTKSLAENLGRPADTLYKSLRRIRKALHECINRTLSREARA